MKRTFYATVVALAFSAPAGAGSFSLGLSADPSGRWYEYFSDAFAEIGRPFNGSQVPDGFFLISALPSYTQIGTGFDVFPFEGNFGNVGTLTFNDAGYSGSGLGVVPVTGLSLDFLPYIAKDASLLGAGSNYTTSVSAVSGTVTLFNGNVSAINLSSSITFTYDFSAFGAGPLPFPGTFSIAGDSFALAADASYPTAFGNLRYRWDFAGGVNNLAPIPEPSTYAMVLAGLALVGVMVRRRRVG